MNELNTANANNTMCSIYFQTGDTWWPKEARPQHAGRGQYL